MSFVKGKKIDNINDIIINEMYIVDTVGGTTYFCTAVCEFPLSRNRIIKMVSNLCHLDILVDEADLTAGTYTVYESFKLDPASKMTYQWNLDKEESKESTNRNHEGHEVVKNYVIANGQKVDFLYCRTCKEEVE